MSFPFVRLAFAVGCIVGCSPRKQPTPPEQPGGVMCTTEAKICPDGTGVGRTGPNCEFAPCPDAAAPAEGGGEAPPATPDAAAAPTP